MAEVNAVPFKVALCGKEDVGKTSIFHRICHDFFPGDENIENRGIQYKEVTVTDSHDRSIKIQLWDTLGMERYAPLTRSHYSNSKIILLVYDSDDMDSLECLESIYDEAIEHAVGADMVLVRNQIDKEMQMVDEDEAFLKLCRGTGGQRQRILASHMATSAKTGQGIAELRTELGNLLSGAEPVRPGTGRFLEDSRDEPTQNSTSTRPSKSCC